MTDKPKNKRRPSTLTVFVIIVVIALVITMFGSTSSNNSTPTQAATLQLPTIYPTNTNTTLPTFTPTPTDTPLPPTETVTPSTTPFSEYSLDLPEVDPGKEPVVSGMTFSSQGCDPATEALVVMIPKDHGTLASFCAPLDVDQLTVTLALKDGLGMPLNKGSLRDKYGHNWTTFQFAVVIQAPYSPTGQYTISGNADDRAKWLVRNSNGENYLLWWLYPNGYATTTYSRNGWFVAVCDEFGGSVGLAVKIESVTSITIK